MCFFIRFIYFCELKSKLLPKTVKHIIFWIWIVSLVNISLVNQQALNLVVKENNKSDSKQRKQTDEEGKQEKEVVLKEFSVKAVVNAPQFTLFHFFVLIYAIEYGEELSFPTYKDPLQTQIPALLNLFGHQIAIHAP